MRGAGTEGDGSEEGSREEDRCEEQHPEEDDPEKDDGAEADDGGEGSSTGCRGSEAEPKKPAAKSTGTKASAQRKSVQKAVLDQKLTKRRKG